MAGVSATPFDDANFTPSAYSKLFRSEQLTKTLGMKDGRRLLDGCGLKLGVVEGRRLDEGAELVVGVPVGMEDGDWAVLVTAG
jgi:hypothetical protein